MTIASADAGTPEPDRPLLASTDALREVLDADLRTMAANERRQARWLQQQEQECSTLLGILVDLAEQHAQVTVHTTFGHLGDTAITALGDDYVALHIPDAPPWLVHLDAITSVEVMTVTGTVDGDRTRCTRGDLAEALRTAAADRPWLVAMTRDGHMTTGTLISVGHDVASVQPAGAPATYVPIAALAAVQAG